MEMLNKHFRMFNSIEILDTSNNSILPICRIQGTQSFTPLQKDLIPEWFISGIPEIYKLFHELLTDVLLWVI